jgi:hypothetical protein
MKKKQVRRFGRVQQQQMLYNELRQVRAGVENLVDVIYAKKMRDILVVSPKDRNLY